MSRSISWLPCHFPAPVHLKRLLVPLGKVTVTADSGISEKHLIGICQSKYGTFCDCSRLGGREEGGVLSGAKRNRRVLGSAPDAVRHPNGDAFCRLSPADI